VMIGVESQACLLSYRAHSLCAKNIGDGLTSRPCR
jgi:hypothetical protein